MIVCCVSVAAAAPPRPNSYLAAATARPEIEFFTNCVRFLIAQSQKHFERENELSSQVSALTRRVEMLERQLLLTQPLHTNPQTLLHSLSLLQQQQQQQQK